MTTVPNQHAFIIHREPVGKNFIQISKENYSKAYRDMSKSPAALGLYIWLVGNQNNFRFAFSPQAIENQLGMARSSCHGAVRKLEELGYLVQREESNVYDFHEVTTMEKEMNRRIVESEMLIFDDTPITPEAPKAKPGEFTF